MIFWRESRSGVSPFLATLEIVNQLLLGDTTIMQSWFYKFCIWGSFSCGLLLFGNAYFTLLVSSAISYFLSYCALYIAQNSTFSYDVFLPFGILSSIYSFKLASERSQDSNQTYFYAFLSGLFLSLSELSRPFVIFLVPIFLYFVFKYFNSKPRRIFFIIALVIFSGAWHAKLLFLNNYQILWSNYSGRNLAGAWIQKITPMVCSDGLISDLYAQREMKRIYNHPCYIAMSKSSQDGIKAYAIENPAYVFKNITRLLGSFFEPRFQRVLYRSPNCAPDCILLTDDETKLPELAKEIYKILVWVFTFSFISTLIIKLGSILLKETKYKTESSDIVGNLIFICLLILIPALALGDDGEQVRFLKSILPILACTPFILGNQLKSLLNKTTRKTKKQLFL